MPLTNAQKVDVRRHCGYGLFGALPSSFQSYRFFQAYGFLEYRMGQTNGTDNMAAEELTVLTTIFLPACNQYEADLVSSTSGIRSNLDTEQAAVWTHNKNEQRDREALYLGARLKLCGFLGVPPGPDLEPAGMHMVL